MSRVHMKCCGACTQEIRARCRTNFGHLSLEDPLCFCVENSWLSMSEAAQNTARHWHHSRIEDHGIKPGVMCSIDDYQDAGFVPLIQRSKRIC